MAQDDHVFLQPLSLEEIAQRIILARDEKNHSEVLRMFNQHVIECWYIFPMGELFSLLQEAVAGIDGFDPNANPKHNFAHLFLSLLGGRDQDTTFDERRNKALTKTKNAIVWAQMAEVLVLRNEGRYVEALAIFKLVLERIEGIQSFDFSQGFRLFVLVNYGVTAMLAGRFQEALNAFSQAQLHPLVPSVSFLTRDAYIRSALIHAVFGDHKIARANLRQAEQIPLSISWAEPLLDSTVEITEVLLPKMKNKRALKQLKKIPKHHLGEMWPFYVYATCQKLLEAGRFNDFRQALKSFEELPFPVVQGQGFTGSVFALMRSRLAMMSGDRNGHFYLDAADQNIVPVKVNSLMFLLFNGNFERVKKNAHDLAEETAGFRRLEMIRLASLAGAHLNLNEFDEARLVLDIAAELPGGFIAADMRYFSDSLRAFAAENGYKIPAFAGRNFFYYFENLKSVRNVSLSDREIEILKTLMFEKDRNKAADLLFISKNTLNSHLRRIYRKLDVNSFDAAVLAAQQLQLI